MPDSPDTPAAEPGPYDQLSGHDPAAEAAIDNPEPKPEAEAEKPAGPTKK